MTSATARSATDSAHSGPPLPAIGRPPQPEAAAPLPTTAVRRVRRIGPTRRGIALFVLGVCCLVLGALARYPGLIGLGIAASVAVVVAVIGLVSKRSVVLRRELPSGAVRRLDPVLAAVSPTARRGGGRGDEVELVERIDGVPLPATKMVIGQSGARLEYPIPTTMPGLVSLGPTELRYFGFAGLSRMRLRDNSIASVLVLARMLPVRIPDNGALPVDTVHGDEIEGGGTELRSLRQYIPGDDIRKVNARISARMGRLMIRQDSEPSISAVTLVVDNATGTPPARYAEMLDVVTSLAGAAIRQGLPVRWTARGRDGASDVDLDGLGITEQAIACLPLSEETVPRIGTTDLTIVVSGPECGPGHLLEALTAADRGGLFVVVGLLADDGDGADRGAAADGAGGVLIQAPTAETVLRRFAHLGSGTAG